MNSRARPILALLALWVAVALPTVADPSSVPDGGVLELHAKANDGTIITTKISSIPMPTEYPFKTAFQWGGDHLEPPKFVIGAITASKGDKQLFLPLSAYSDLGNPRLASLVVTADGARLKIVGGDAGGAYDAVFTFDASGLKERRVSSREFPNRAWEETKYSYNDVMSE